MNTQKIAVSIPSDLLAMIDKISNQKGMSRSRFISTVLREKITDEKKRHLKNTYDSVFSDESIRGEQLETAKWFEGEIGVKQRPKR